MTFSANAVELPQDHTWPRGFIVDPNHAHVVPGHFVPRIEVEGLFVHPWLQVASHHEAPGASLVLLGECVAVTSNRPSGLDLLYQILAHQGEDAFLAELDHYAGRFCFLYRTKFAPDEWKVVQDASGMRSVFFNTRTRGLASHAALISDGELEQIDPKYVPHRFGYPGNWTPHQNVRILTPNTTLGVKSQRQRRFWPRGPLRQTLSPREAASEMLPLVTEALRRNNDGQRANYLALSAGNDSRVLLAVFLAAGVPVETYTCGATQSSATDRKVASVLAERAGVPHTVVENKCAAPSLTAHLDEVHFKLHHPAWVPGLVRWIDDPRAVTVNGVLLEIGRRFYGGSRDRGASTPTTSDGMWQLHRQSMGYAVRQEQKFRGPSVARQAKQAFGSFVEDTEWLKGIEYVNSFDLFYWEHRMSTWYGASLLERELYGNPFSPFNSRRVFEIMLAVPEQERRGATMFLDMVSMVCPDLLDLPINSNEIRGS